MAKSSIWRKTSFDENIDLQLKSNCHRGKFGTTDDLLQEYTLRKFNIARTSNKQMRLYDANIQLLYKSVGIFFLQNLDKCYRRLGAVVVFVQMALLL